MTTKKPLQLKPDFPECYAAWIRLKDSLCDWQDYELNYLPSQLLLLFL